MTNVTYALQEVVCDVADSGQQHEVKSAKQVQRKVDVRCLNQGDCHGAHAGQRVHQRP